MLQSSYEKFDMMFMAKETVFKHLYQLSGGSEQRTANGCSSGKGCAYVARYQEHSMEKPVYLQCDILLQS